MSRGGMLVAVIILAIISFVLLLVVVKLRMQLKQAASGSTEMGDLKVQPVSGDSMAGEGK